MASQVNDRGPRTFERPNHDAHVILLHEKLTKRKSDRYILNLGLAFEKIGYKVTIVTSQFDRQDSEIDVKFSDKIDVVYSGWWLPKSFLGLFRTTASSLKAAWMALRLIFYPPDPKPEIIVLDVGLVAVYLLHMLSHYKIFFVETFTELKNTDACFEHSRLSPSLLDAKWIKLAHEIIVESDGFAEIMKKSFPGLKKRPQVLYPSIDLGMWKEPSIKIQRIIPDLLENTIIFLSVGKFRRSSNFRLALDAFEVLLEYIDDKTITKRFQLVIAGNCKSLDESFYYNELIASAKERLCATQVTILKQLPIIHEKTLIMESAIVIHPAKNDVYSDFILKAMSLGKPIVACNKGIASNVLIHRLSGVIVVPEARLFAVAIKKMMMSPHLQLFLGDMAKDAFEKGYSFDSFCAKLSSILKKPVVEDSDITLSSEISRKAGVET